MHATQLYFPTLKEIPADTDIASHQLMLRAGLIRRVAAGVYTWLPLGIRVLRKVESIIREEMDAIGAQECSMPIMQPSELWEETKRRASYGFELMHFQDRHEREFFLGPTHEEIITDLIRKEVRSYKQLPLTLYQIQTKFRDEIRPRFGLLRAREFLMKDAYSFHSDTVSLNEIYQKMYGAYLKIFKRLGLEIKVVEADTGSIGGHTSHEFQVLAETGENSILYSTSSDYAINEELLEKATQDNTLPYETLKKARGIEVGHIFQLGSKYSQAMNAQVTSREGRLELMEMGCYGLGVSRIVAAAIEQRHDALGIQWSNAMTPFEIVIIPIGYERHETIKLATDILYKELKSISMNVLLDDRNIRPGIAFNEMDLIGIPYRLVVNTAGLSRNQVEFRARGKDSQWVALTEIANFLKTILLNTL